MSWNVLSFSEHLKKRHFQSLYVRVAVFSDTVGFTWNICSKLDLHFEMLPRNVTCQACSLGAWHKYLLTSKVMRLIFHFTQQSTHWIPGNEHQLETMISPWPRTHRFFTVCILTPARLITSVGITVSISSAPLARITNALFEAMSGGEMLGRWLWRKGLRG